MYLNPSFPTMLHTAVAEIVKNYFLAIPQVDTVLLVNSCARGQADAESDLDFAILINTGTSLAEKQKIKNNWETHVASQPTIIKYKQSNRFAHLHLDIIDGNYVQPIFEIGSPVDYFELEIGNQISYSAPLGDPGEYFKRLQDKWLPYYNNDLRLQRLTMARDACEYDLEHIPIFVRRDLFFHAFAVLIKAFEEYLQTIFIANKIYPVSYNKWIRYQITELLKKPDLYPKLSPILSVCNIESNEINEKVIMLRKLLDEVTHL